VLEVEVLGAREPDGLSAVRIRRLCILAAASAGVEEGHLAIEFVDAERIASLNAEHRGASGPTDVLSFPIDGAAPAATALGASTSRPDRAGAGETRGGAPPRELGDVVICPECTEDLYEAIVHGVLHLVGMDHESDGGEMLAVQAELLRWESLPASGASLRAQW
jgi:probable rRNA maturation factor